MDTIKCGRCGNLHESVADVRACYNGQPVESKPQEIPAAYRATEKQVTWINKIMAERHLVMDKQADQLPKRGPESASELLDYLFDKKGNVKMPTGFGLRPDPAWEGESPSASDGASQDRTNGSGPKRTLPDVPAGHYAVVSATGRNDLDFYRVDRPTEGRWAGHTFIKRVIGGHPNQPVRGKEIRSALERISEAGPREAATRYGQEIGRCWKCNRHLTDETSRALGIGPDCREQIGAMV